MFVAIAVHTNAGTRCNAESNDADHSVSNWGPAAAVLTAQQQGLRSRTLRHQYCTVTFWTSTTFGRTADGQTDQQ
jgi:hypothetical protein